jgi:hypothetical protein
MDTTHSIEKSIMVSSGYQVRILGMPQTLIDKITATKKYPPTPTYLAPTATDPDARLPHEYRMAKEQIWNADTESYDTKEVLHSTLTTDEDKRVWNEYLVACAVEDKRVANKVMEALMLRGIAVETETTNDNWEEVQTFLGIVVPQEPIAKRIHWLTTEVLRTNQDLSQILEESLRATGVPEEQLDTILGSFRSDMERTKATPAA